MTSTIFERRPVKRPLHATRAIEPTRRHRRLDSRPETAERAVEVKHLSSREYDRRWRLHPGGDTLHMLQKENAAIPYLQFHSITANELGLWDHSVQCPDHRRAGPREIVRGRASDGCTRDSQNERGRRGA